MRTSESGSRAELRSASRLLGMTALLAVLAAGPSSVQALGVEPSGRLSWGLFGAEANDTTYGAQITADGRYAVYASKASNLGFGDTNGVEDVFRYDRLTGATLPISLGPALTFIAGWSKVSPFGKGITPDGRYVLFYSSAALVTGDTNGVGDVFVRDTNGLGSTRRVSLTNAEGQLSVHSFPVGISSDGRYAFFMTAAALEASDTNGADDVYRRDLVSDATVRMTPSPNGGTWWPSISRDGRYLVFSTQAALVFRDTNTLRDVYLYDTSLNTYTLISANAAGNATGGETAQISPNGDAVSYVIPGAVREPRIYYRSSRTFRTPAPSSPDANPLRRCVVNSLSFSGRYAAVQCDHIYPGSGDDWISQGFCLDTFNNTSGMFSRSAAGAEGNNAAQSVDMTEDGRGVVMTSSANNLVPGDTNAKSDAFFAYCQ